MILTNNLRNILFIHILIFNAQIPAWAQDSIIDTALKAQDSIVTVQAMQTHLYSGQQAEGKYDPKSKKLQIARKIKKATFARQAAGVIIRPDGVIVTNLHTIRNANQVFIKLVNHQTYPARILHVMPEHDLALLKINAPLPLTPITFSDSNNVRLGDEIIHIGSSEILKDTLSGGKVTGLAKSTRRPQSIELIRVNINIYKGDSGGPLLDRHGRLIGMIVAKTRTRQKESFAIPSNKIKKLYMDFLN